MTKHEILNKESGQQYKSAVFQTGRLSYKDEGGNKVSPCFSNDGNLTHFEVI